MTAAYLSAPESAGTLMQSEYRPGCTGKLKQGRFEAVKAAVRRGRGTVYECPRCRSWHTSSFIGPQSPSWATATAPTKGKR